MNDDINIYDGAQIEGSSEAKSRNTWVEMFDMIGMFFFFLTFNTYSLNFCLFTECLLNEFIYLFAKIYFEISVKRTRSKTVLLAICKHRTRI